VRRQISNEHPVAHKVDVVGDEARLSLWVATGTLDAADVSAFRRGDTDFGVLEARHIAQSEANDRVRPAARDEADEPAPTGSSHADRWARFQASA
jgi:hypothetical protein